MKKRSKAPMRTKGMAQVHDKLVDRIVSNAPPVKPVTSVFAQWSIWLALSTGVMVLFLVNFHLQTGADQILGQMPPLAFLITAYLGAALAAWEAVASSVPGRQTGKGYKVLSLLVLGALIFVPFAFFYPSGAVFDVWGSFVNGMECVQRVCLVGLLPWIYLGRRLSRNASFSPAWTGAWSGVSAFLLGTVTVQLHCPSWDARHMVSAHLLPVLFLIFFTTFIGSYWFGRWRK